MSSRTVMRRRARPGPTSSRVMPSPALARSSASIASALARASATRSWTSGTPAASLHLAQPTARARQPQERRAGPVAPAREDAGQLAQDGLDVDAGRVQPVAPLQRAGGVAGAQDHR